MLWFGGKHLHALSNALSTPALACLQHLNHTCSSVPGALQHCSVCVGRLVSQQNPAQQPFCDKSVSLEQLWRTRVAAVEGSRKASY